MRQSKAFKEISSRVFKISESGKVTSARSWSEKTTGFNTKTKEIKEAESHI